MDIHGKEYTPVNDRLKILYGESDRVFPNAYVLTEVAWHNPDLSAILFKATIYPNDVQGDARSFTGFAYEERDASSSQVNFSSWVENCETSAIGRALANMDIGTAKGRVSQEEMARPERIKSSLAVPVAGVTPKKILKMGETAPSPTAKVIALGLEYKRILGSDQLYQQILADHDAIDLKKSTLETLNQVGVKLEDTLNYCKAELQKLGANAVKDLVDEKVREEILANFKKVAILPF